MPRDRLTKEELHDDEFTESIVRIVSYVEHNYPKILAGLGAVVVAILIGYFVQDSANRRTQAALDAIGDVQVALMQGNTSSAITKAQAVIRDYSGEDIAGRALVTLGNVYYDQGRFDEATSHYRQFLEASDNPGGPEGYGAYAGIAASMEAQGNAAGAAQQYLSYADRFGKTPFAALALLESARCNGVAGQVEEAKSIYQRIRADYASSSAARSAQTELELLGIVAD
jgi:TolA-binding protein